MRMRIAHPPVSMDRWWYQHTAGCRMNVPGPVPWCWLTMPALAGGVRLPVRRGWRFGV